MSLLYTIFNYFSKLPSGCRVAYLSCFVSCSLFVASSFNFVISYLSFDISSLKAESFLDTSSFGTSFEISSRLLTPLDSLLNLSISAF